MASLARRRGEKERSLTYVYTLLKLEFVGLSEVSIRHIKEHLYSGATRQLNSPPFERYMSGTNNVGAQASISIGSCFIPLHCMGFLTFRIL